jgi:hypothetical protein
VHHNTPGGLGRLNEVVAQRGVNIAAQYCQTDSQIGYVVLDLDGRLQDAEGLLADIRGIPGTICARLCLSRSTSRTFLISSLPSAIWVPTRWLPADAAKGPGADKGQEQAAQSTERDRQYEARKAEHAFRRALASRRKPRSPG